MQYRREIDGLRAIAVLPVILFHAGFSVFSGGYVGVDVFFVISGYLITSILISELEQGKFSILRFYERRARRILPALFFVMLACLPFAYMWMLPSQLEDFAKSLVAVVFFGSNILFWRESGYFGADAELKPLLHTWSLAVEEQYYLIFPIFLLLAWRFGRNKVFWSVVVIAAISLLLAEWGWRNKPSANFYLAPTRAWELLAGSICAFLTVGRTPKSNNILSAIGLAAIVFAIFVFDDNTPFPSVYALVPVVGTALIILFGRQGTWVAQLLSMRALVGIGLISYSAYLWHQPLFAFARLRSLTEPTHYLMGLLAVAALLLAWATWRWVEQPFRKRANPVLVTRRSVFAASGAVGAVFVTLGLATHFSHRVFHEDGTIGNEMREVTAGRCNFNFGQCFEIPDANIQVALWGDSYADAFSVSLGKVLNENGIGLTLYVRHSCPSLLGVLRNEDARLGSGNGTRCSEFSNNTLSSIDAGGFDLVIMTSAYYRYATGLNHEDKPIILDDGVKHIFEGEGIVEAALGETVVAIESTGADVLLVTPHPLVDDFDHRLKLFYWDEVNQIHGNYQPASHLRDRLIAALNRRGISWTEENGLLWFCDGSRCSIIDNNNRSLLFDGSHISTTMAPIVAGNLFQKILLKMY